jgi:hypothetical protein
MNLHPKLRDVHEAVANIYWAAGVLLVLPSDLADPCGALVLAQQHHAMLRQWVGQEYHLLLDIALAAITEWADEGGSPS